MSKNSSTTILNFVKENPLSSSSEIHSGVGLDIGYATTKRVLANLVSEGLIAKEGQGRGTKYKISTAYELIFPIDQDNYFQQEIDDRKIRSQFNLDLIPKVLGKVRLFTDSELSYLNNLQKQYHENISQLDEEIFKKEMERLAIDLSWKSSQIEGNTYSLLETERLLKEKETAKGKTKEEAIMLLNHKEALDFIMNDPSYLMPLTVSRIEDIHSILIKDLGINRNIRRQRVGITGTNYRPLDNEHQIREAFQGMCDLVNDRENVFEKAFLPLVLISYIQGFSDGNKRTARIISNAVLAHYRYCPISFRTVDSIDYKKATLLFYEQNNISAFKKIFTEQYKFAVETYF